MSKLTFKGVSQCIPTMNILYSFQPLSLLSITPIPSTFHFSTAFNTYIYIFYLHRCYVLYYWCSVILFSLPSFPEFHSIVPLLQTCFMYEFVFDHSCFVHIFIFWIYFPHMRENMQPLSFWAWLPSLNMMSSNCIHLPSNYMLSLWLSKISLCIYTTFSWSIH
jgi:hypothetical protein